MTTYVAETKVFWKSKMFWANLLVFVGAGISAISGEYLTAGTLTVTSVTNIILRLYTSQGVSLAEN